MQQMELSCRTEDITCETGLSLSKGEVEFADFGTGGHRAHYIIAPRGMEDADEILRWMFIRPDGWRLKPPNLLLSCYGGRDHYVNWAQSETLLNREAWENQPASSDMQPSGARRSHLKQKVDRAGAMGQPLPAMADFKFKKKFTSRLAEISAGVCQAVTECGGWFDLGFGKRGGLNEVLMDGLKVYWSAFGCLAGHKDGAVVFCVRFLDETEFKEQFEECSVPTSASDDSLKRKRVIYPSVNEKLFPELGRGTDDTADEQDLSGFGEPDAAESCNSTLRLDKEVRAHISHRFLCNALTHIIFVRNQQTHDRLRSKLRCLATRATIFANGHESLIQPGVNGKVLMEAMAGVPVVCLHNTGCCFQQSRRLAWHACIILLGSDRAPLGSPNAACC